MNSSPFKIPFKPAAQAQTQTKAATDVSKIRLLDLNLLADQWNSMNVAEKADAINARFSGLNGEEKISLIARLDATHPKSPETQFIERVVYVPSAAGQAGLSPATPSPMSLLGWAAVLLVVGGLFYSTVKE